MVDVNRLAESWALVSAHGDQVPLRFYGRLFVAHPELRDLFPISMAAQRDRLVRALGLVVSQAGQLEAITPFLQELGREHRRFTATPEHYAAVGEALLDTIADFLGDLWTPELAGDWVQAYRLVGRVMIEAADDAAHTPAWWDTEVLDRDQRTFDITVLTVRPDGAYPYVPGQSMAVETALRPRLWRYFSPANAPRADGTLDLHVRRVPGGPVSSALVDQVDVGDRLRLGAPIGRDLTLRPTGGRDLLLIAGGTGLAPLKALVDQVVGDPLRAGASTVRLFVGARTVRELYDLDHLRELADRHPWLVVVPVVSDDDHHPHADGMVADIALLRSPDPLGHEIYVCGSREMVEGTRARLHAAGCPPERVHHESFVGLADGLDKPDGIDGLPGMPGLGTPGLGTPGLGARIRGVGEGTGIDGGAAHLESER